MKPWPREILELAYWVPLAVLVLVSVARIALDRRNGPFYLISIPVATLIAGLEWLLFGIVSVYAYFAAVDPAPWPQAVAVLLFRMPLIWPWETASVLVSSCAVCVAGFTSFSALKRELSNDGEAHIEKKQRQRLKGLLLTFALVCTWLSLRYVVVHFMSTRYMDLRIVWASSCDARSRQTIRIYRNSDLWYRQASTRHGSGLHSAALHA